MVTLLFPAANPIPSLPPPTRPVAPDELSKNRRFWIRSGPIHYIGNQHPRNGVVSQHRHQRERSHLKNEKTALYGMILATMVSYNPSAISASGVQQLVLTDQDSAVGPDGVSRCRLRPPTSQAARCVAPHLRYQEKLAIRGTRASVGERKKTSMLHFYRW